MATPITAWGALGRRRTPSVTPPAPPRVSTAWGSRPSYTVPPGYMSTPMGSTPATIAAYTTSTSPNAGIHGWGSTSSVVHPPGTPVGAVTPPRPAAPPPAPKPIDWAAIINADPRMIAAAPGLASRISQADAQYGFAPDAQGNLQVDTAASPFSAAGLLKNQLGQDSESAQNAANARGILFSGAQVGAQQAAQNAYQQNLYKALNALQGILQGVATDKTNLYNTIYSDLAAKQAKGA